MKFTEAYIDEVKTASNIVNVVKEYTTLKKRHRDYVACCPFHKEKTPSFTVSATKELFYCFGCSQGGSVFTFIQKIENLSFPEAVKFLAENAGIPLPEDKDTEKYIKEAEAKERVIDANRSALRYWQEQLKSSEVATKYLANRGVTQETIDEFHIGYAPDSFDALLQHLKKEKFTDEEIRTSGLVGEKEGKVYDRFRDRIITPIYDFRGKPIAFGGRSISGKEPKYLNSPETKVFIKGNHLYGLNTVKDIVRKRGFAVLTEGYFDFLSLYQEGIKNAVAGLGTALTTNQARLLKRVTDKVVICYDGDSAGINASLKALETLVETGFEIKVLSLPQGVDPDDFVKRNGAAAFEKLRATSLRWFDFVVRHVKQTYDIKIPAEKAKAVEALLAFINKVSNVVERRDYFDLGMEALHVSSSVKQKLWNENTVNDALESIVESPLKKMLPSEKRLLTLLVNNADVRNAIFDGLTAEDYIPLLTSKIFLQIIRLAEEDEVTEANLSSVLEPEDFSLLTGLLISEKDEEFTVDELIVEAQGCLEAIRAELSRKELDSLHDKLAIATGEDATKIVDEIMKKTIQPEMV